MIFYSPDRYFRRRRGDALQGKIWAGGAQTPDPKPFRFLNLRTLSVEPFGRSIPRPPGAGAVHGDMRLADGQEHEHRQMRSTTDGTPVVRAPKVRSAMRAPKGQAELEHR